MAITTATTTTTNTATGNSKAAGVNGGIFVGLRFVLELGVISLQNKKELLALIEGNGGKIDFVICKKVCVHSYFYQSSEIK